MMINGVSLPSVHSISPAGSSRPATSQTNVASAFTKSSNAQHGYKRKNINTINNEVGIPKKLAHLNDEQEFIKKIQQLKEINNISDYDKIEYLDLRREDSQLVLSLFEDKHYFNSENAHVMKLKNEPSVLPKSLKKISFHMFPVDDPHLPFNDELLKDKKSNNEFELNLCVDSHMAGVA